jgi:hypothetical protein
MRLSSFRVASILAVLACGPKPPPDNAFITTDRGSIGFGQEFGSGTTIGQMPQENLAVNNLGLADLHITAITFTGDSAFTVKPLVAPPITVKGMQSTFVNIIFNPTEPKMYTGKINIASDAENTKSLDVPISGLGIAPDAG